MNIFNSFGHFRNCWFLTFVKKFVGSVILKIRCIPSRKQFSQQRSKTQDIGLKRIRSPGSHVISRPSPRQFSCKWWIVLFTKTFGKAKISNFCNWMPLACFSKQRIARRKVSVHNVVFFQLSHWLYRHSFRNFTSPNRQGFWVYGTNICF